MNKIKLFNPLAQKIKSLANDLLLSKSPIERLLASSNRFLALQNFANVDRFLEEINLAFKDLEQYVEKLRTLIDELNRYGASITSG